MSHEYILWIALAAYGIHALEEYELNWRDWARSVLRLPVEWGSFYVVNALVVVLGVCCAMVGWQKPSFALGFAALMIINATFFHVLPTIVTRVYSPGLATALALFYPVAGWAYYGAQLDGVLSPGTGVVSAIFGALLMAAPIVLLKVKDRKMFAYGSDPRRESTR
ncbi:MAG TPA: HXXEE domain-containing protein [Pirellulales bacterium]|nr:HXXEE domain-containing protein [Pirellulales bacterium]